jgi:hypothetical protein
MATTHQLVINVFRSVQSDSTEIQQPNPALLVLDLFTTEQTVEPIARTTTMLTQSTKCALNAFLPAKLAQLLINA